jgi:D-arabinose 1-dehydrogenase-like Zn-dependent alcohol dehydrogenase
MRAVVYRGVNDLRLETVPVPQIGANELLVKVAVCGVCPTDIKKIQHGLVPPPRIFGHETAGTIVKIGASGSKTQNSKLKIQNLKVGDRVALHHHVPCGRCHFCRHRAFAQCATYKRTGITAGFEPAGGGYAEYVRVLPFVLPGVVKIPAANSFAEGAMLEPVNTILKAVKRLNLLPGDTALVAGQGPIGLMFTKILQLARVRVLATDLLESRLKLAKKFGAKWTKLVSSPQSSVHSRGNRVSDCGLWTGDFGLWTGDFGLWTDNCGLWTGDFGLCRDRRPFRRRRSAGAPARARRRPGIIVRPHQTQLQVHSPKSTGVTLRFARREGGCGLWTADCGLFFDLPRRKRFDRQLLV